jgi:hypothetical protein
MRIYIIGNDRITLSREPPAAVNECTALLKQQKAPSELDHATPDPSVACFGEPLFSPLRATLVRCVSQTGEARHRFSITHPPREHLMDEHICCFNADSDDPSQQQHHGVWPALRLRF